MFRRLFVLLAAGLCLGAHAPEDPAVAPAPRVESGFKMKGSDSMDPLVRLWLSGFEKQNPGVEVTVMSHGSGTAPPALTSGEVRLGHMSREMTPEEQVAFQTRHGYPVTRLVVAMDALAIYVNRSNPVRRISLGQLDGIYSRTRLSGWDKALERWGDLGAGGRWRKRPITFYGRDEKSGTRSFFDERILQKGGALRTEYQVRDQWGIEEAISKDVSGIGYGPANYANPDVRMLPVLAWSGMYYLPTVENVANGRYPLARKLNLYVDKEPGKPLPPALSAFLTFVVGPQGQRLVQEYGSVAISKDLAEAQLRALER